MCGICGKLSNSGVDHDEIRRMSNALAHRGPDDEGFYFASNIGLAHRRLSIIDLDHGKQPIGNEDSSIWIVYNGEVYNFQALRSELIQKGHTFKTNTDSEVIIHLYEELGEKCVERLNGMFAFAIWDEKKQKLFLGRDRLGQKPLFYAQEGNNFLFASEAKSILAAQDVQRAMDLESIHHYLSLRFIPAPGTMFRSIKKLPPGHCLVHQNQKITITRYWDLDFRQKLELSEAQFITLLEEKLSAAVHSHLVSDVPVGAYLSGGMDSSIVVAMMSKFLPGTFKTFAIGVEEEDYNELPYARMVAEHYHTDHIEQTINSDLIQFLPRMIWQLDEPSDPIAACMFQASELAAKHVKVVLGGDGGDELFAGFDRYVGVKLIDHYTVIPSLIRQKIIGPLINALPDSFTYKSFSQKVRWMHQLSTFNGGARYAEATCFFRFSHDDKKALYSQDFWRRFKDLPSADVIIKQYDNAKANDPIDRMLYADFMTRLSEHTLMLTDRMNMAHGLEARSPFLDHTLVELLASFPSNLKIKGRNLKYILRKTAEPYLPETILKRKKQGFMFPVAYWFRNELYGFLNKLFQDSRLVKEGIFNKTQIFSLLEDHRSSKVDNSVRLWMLLNLEIWYLIYIEQYDLATVEDRVRGYL